MAWAIKACRNSVFAAVRIHRGPFNGASLCFWQRGRSKFHLLLAWQHFSSSAIVYHINAESRLANDATS